MGNQQRHPGRQTREWFLVAVITLTPSQGGVGLRLVRLTIIQSSQARVIPIAIHQSRPFRGTSLELIVRTASPSGDGEILLSLPVTQLPHWSSNDSPTSFIKSTYLFSGFTPTAFLVKPPLGSPGTPQAPVVALRKISATTSWNLLVDVPIPIRWCWSRHLSSTLLERCLAAAGPELDDYPVR